MPKRKEIVPGTRFGRLVVIEEVSQATGQRRRMKCRCDCGVVKEAVHLSALTSGLTQSCGCLQREIASETGKTHGESKTTPEYRAWISIKRRCLNPNSKDYPDYGGRGIMMFEEWKDSYLAFLEYVGRKPSAKYSIDRIDNEGHYEPGNVKWSSPEEQARNKRNNRIIEFGGESKTITEWTEQLGLKRGCIQQRIDRYGWSVERALAEIPRSPSDNQDKR